MSSYSNIYVCRPYAPVTSVGSNIKGRASKTGGLHKQKITSWGSSDSSSSLISKWDIPGPNAATGRGRHDGVKMVKRVLARGGFFGEREWKGSYDMSLGAPP